MSKMMLVAALMAVFGLGRASCETYTMESYYPAPVGVYTNMTVTGNAVLARDSGKVSIGGAPTTTAKLEVKGDANINGVVVPGSFAADPTASDQKIEGAIYFNTTLKKHRVFQNASWTDLGGGGSVLAGNGATMVLPAGGPYKMLVWGTYFTCEDFLTSLRLDGVAVKSFSGFGGDTQGCDQNTIMARVTGVNSGTHTWSFSRGSQWDFNWMVY